MAKESVVIAGAGGISNAWFPPSLGRKSGHSRRCGFESSQRRASMRKIRSRVRSFQRFAGDAQKTRAGFRAGFNHSRRALSGDNHRVKARLSCHRRKTDGRHAATSAQDGKSQRRIRQAVYDQPIAPLGQKSRHCTAHFAKRQIGRNYDYQLRLLHRRAFWRLPRRNGFAADSSIWRFITSIWRVILPV